jgi:hypothetical protein
LRLLLMASLLQMKMWGLEQQEKQIYPFKLWTTDMRNLSHLWIAAFGVFVPFRCLCFKPKRLGGVACLHWCDRTDVISLWVSNWCGCTGMGPKINWINKWRVTLIGRLHHFLCWTSLYSTLIIYSARKHGLYTCAFYINQKSSTTKLL